VKTTSIQQVQKHLKELMHIDSNSFNKRGVRECLAYIERNAPSSQFNLENLKPNSPEFVDALHFKPLHIDKSKPRVLLVGHVDTVMESADFEYVGERDNILYGSGVIDMKVGVAMILQLIIDLYAESNLQNVGVLITTEEEQGANPEGYPGLTDVAKQYDAALVFEADGCLAVPSKNYKQKNLVVKRKGLLVAELKAEASGGHSGSIGEEGKRHSAVHELINQANSLMDQQDFAKGTTCNIGVFEGGKAFNVLAETASIEFDFRMQDLDEFNRLRSFLKTTPNSANDKNVQLQVNLRVQCPPLMYTEKSKRLFEILQDVGSAQAIEIGPEHRGGGSDANRLWYHKPDLAVLDNFGPLGEGEHTAKEALYLDSIESNYKFALAALERILIEDKDFLR
jgi:glutamate carboxypeptidase